MKKLLGLFVVLGLAILLFTFAIKVEQDVNEEGIAVAITELNAYSYAEAVEKAAKEDKPVLIYFGATWCGPCVNFKRTILSRNDVINEINKNFVFVMIDVDDKDTAAVQREFGVQYIPHIASQYHRERAKYGGRAFVTEFMTWLKNNEVKNEFN